VILPGRLLLVLLAVQAVLSATAGLAAVLPACAACGTGRLAPALLGALGYSVLFGRALTAGLTRDVFVGILFAGGIHAALVVQMLTTGLWCGLCIAAALLSLVMMGGSVMLDRTNVGRLALVTPTAALLVLSGGSAAVPSAPREATDGRIGILVYSQPECGFCEELQRNVLPEVEKEFGSRIRVEQRSADELPGIRRTPTLILNAKRPSTATRVIEGLPTVERLRGVIRDLEAAR